MHAVWDWSRIDMSVSPIRDEFTVEKGTPLTRTLQYTNNSDLPYNIYVTVEDCSPSGNYWTPICKSASWSGIQTQFSSTWITVNETNFVVPPRTTKTIEFTVNAPANATPGGHYGAIFFNNPDTPVYWANTVCMIRRIGMLYMLRIPGTIIVDPSIGSILVDWPGGWMNWEGAVFTSLNFNSAPELIEAIKKKWNTRQEILDEVNPIWEKPVLKDSNFAINLKVPVRNDWNIHILPTGKIYLFDENDIQLEKIGKESIVDENWVYVGENIVNYLPINDERWNVLPNTERTYQVDWLGFGYEEKDPLTWKYVIKFEWPGEYYTRLTEEESQYIYPWERLSIRSVSRELKWKIELSYNDITTGKDVTNYMEVPITIKYSYIAKSLNYWMLFIIVFICLLSWIFIRARDNRIVTLEDVNHELEDEITVLERVSKAHMIKKESTSPSLRKSKPKVVPETTTNIGEEVTEKKKAAPRKTTKKKSSTEEANTVNE